MARSEIIKVNCGFCKKEFDAKRNDYERRVKKSKSGLVFCNKQCMGKYTAALSPIVSATCGFCKKTFPIQQGQRSARISQSKNGLIFCKTECFLKYKQRNIKTVEIECGHCKEPIEITESKYKERKKNSKSGLIFCNTSCQSKHQSDTCKLAFCVVCGNRNAPSGKRYGSNNDMCSKTCSDKFHKTLINSPQMCQDCKEIYLGHPGAKRCKPCRKIAKKKCSNFHHKAKNAENLLNSVSLIFSKESR